MTDALFINKPIEIATKSIEDESIDLVVTSPPYNIGKEYEKERRLSLDEYIDWLEVIIKEIEPKLSKSGSIVWQTGNHVSDTEIFPLDILTYPIFKKLGFKLRNRVIWQFNFGLHAQKRLSGRYETALWFTRSDEYTFNLDPIRVPQLYPGKRKSNADGGKLSGNPKGKNPSDFWEFSAEEFFRNEPIWKIPNVKSNHVEKTSHPCQFPFALAERFILACSNPGDTILDPFLGSGTTVLAAYANGRNSIGVDLDKNYIKISKARLEELKKGTLRIRPGYKNVIKPNKKQKVAKVPDEWL